jgi:hypothetical protein
VADNKFSTDLKSKNNKSLMMSDLPQYDHFEEEKVPLKKRKYTKELTKADFDHSELSAMAAPDKYYKKFDFFYKRTCFRLMAEFYKLLFSPF